MMQSYLGVITSRGLQSLFLESDYILRVLARLAYAEQPARAVCYWAAMQAPEATRIQEQLEHRQGFSAPFFPPMSVIFGYPEWPSEVA